MEKHMDDREPASRKASKLSLLGQPIPQQIEEVDMPPASEIGPPSFGERFANGGTD